MSAKPSSFKVTNLKRGVQGVRLAGLEVGRVEIGGDGKIIIIPKDQEPRKEAPKKVAAGELQAWD